MILLEFESRIISEALFSRLEAIQDGQPADPISVKLADFDGVQYHISNPSSADKDFSKIQISISARFYSELKPYGVDEYMQNIYGPMVVAPEEGYDFTLLIDLNQLGTKPAAVISSVARVRRNCFGALFNTFFERQKALTPAEKASTSPVLATAVIHHRSQETITVLAMKDRVTVVFSTLFSDADDVVIGKVFMQAFSDVRGKNPQAPQVLFKHKDPPDELSGQSALTGENVGYITFVLTPRHYQDKNKEETIDLIHTFRNYLHYHIKCSKAYLHSRMRARTTALLKVLNRARPESESKEKKTITGKSFIRK